MCKYCEDTSYEREETTKKEYSYPHFFGDLSNIDLHYEFDVQPICVTTYEQEIKVIPHFCPMCGKKLKECVKPNYLELIRIDNCDRRSAKIMNKKEKEDRIELIASTIQQILVQIDVFQNMMTSEDIDLLIECKESLKEKILHNESAMTLILALGGNYDSAEDEMKIETLDCLIRMIRARNEYKEKVIEEQNKMKEKQEFLKMLNL